MPQSSIRLFVITALVTKFLIRMHSMLPSHTHSQTGRTERNIRQLDLIYVRRKSRLRWPRLFNGDGLVARRGQHRNVYDLRLKLHTYASTPTCMKHSHAAV